VLRLPYYRSVPLGRGSPAEVFNMAARGNVLPLSLPPRGLSRVESAAYVGVSPSLFDSMVKDRRMPPPKRINGRTVWDRKRLDAAFDALPDDGDGSNPWDEVAA
jgi:predicted DNA-binding transcriptional regulator AlpA